MTMIKTVIFDIDDTLYSFHKANATAFQVLTEYVTANLGLSADTFRRLHQEAMKESSRRMGDVAAIHNRTIRFQYILEHNGLPLHPHVLEMDRLYWDTLIQVSVPSPGALAALETLKKQNIKIGIGTDMTARVQFQKLTRLGMLSYIDFLVSSEEACAEKPAPAFFQCCVEKAGCDASECVFVGDNLKKDVLGPEAAGLKAIWYHPAGTVPEEASLQITDLGCLPQIISGMN